MRRSLTVILLAGVSGCVAGPPPERATAPEQDRIAVTIEGDRGATYDRVLAVLVDVGLTVYRGDRDGGIIVSTPVRSGGMISGDFVYRAMILSEGDSSRIVLQALTRCADCQALAQAIAGADPGESGWRTVTSHWGGEGAKAWDQLELIAAALRRS